MQMTIEILAEHPVKVGKFGTRLKIAREALHLTEKDMAARLHLNPQVITALEQEDFQNGPPMVFLRGYLRSYARLLNFTDADINHALTQWADTVNSAAISTSKMPKMQKTKVDLLHSNHPYMRWTTYFIIVLLVSLVGMWWYAQARHNGDKIPEQATAIAATPTDNTAAQAPTMPAPTPNTVAIDPTSNASTEAAAPAISPANTDSDEEPAPPLKEKASAAVVGKPTPASKKLKPGANEMVIPEPGLEDN
jgi:cytoskeleton protein RodZ